MSYGSLPSLNILPWISAAWFDITFSPMVSCLILLKLSKSLFRMTVLKFTAKPRL